MHRHIPSLLDPTGWRVLSALLRSQAAPIYICDDDKHLRRTRRLLALGAVARGRCVFIGSRARQADEHQIDYLLSFGGRTPAALRADSYPVPPGVPAYPRLAQDPAEAAAMRAWTAARGWSGRELILVQPGNRRTMSTRRGRHRKFDRDAKAWPIERWTDLFPRIHARMPTAMILLCGARQEVPVLHELRAAANLDAVVVASLPLRRLFGLCQLAHSMISIDTGPAHAAAALGVPLVVLFGSQPQSRYLPRSAGSPVIGLGGPPISSHVDQISVDMVFSAWCSLAGQIPAQPQRAAGEDRDLSIAAASATAP
jgi:heptosyltransferase-2/heptosyltransferase-3